MVNDTQHQGQWEGAECAAPVLQDGDVLAFHASASGGPELRVRALRPSLHPELADAVEALHREALRRHGVAGVVSMTSPLRAMAATWLLVAEAPEDGCVAGVRVDLRDGAHALPLERALAPFGGQQLAKLRRRFAGRVGELAGLWVREDARKLGLAGALISAGVAAARRAGLTRLFTLASLHTRAIVDARGFRVLRALGDEGEFLYPNERYRSYVMDIDLVRGTAESSRVVCKAIHEETLR